MHRSPGVLPSEVEVPPAELRFAAAPSPLCRSARRIATAFEAAIADALEAAVHVDRDPIGAVHDFRRAARRARAILAAVAPRIAAGERTALDAMLRGSIRAIGALRDRDVLPVALADLPFRRGTGDVRAALEAELLSERFAAARPRLRQRRLAVAAARLTLLPERLATALPRPFSATDLAAGLERLARRARKSARLAVKRPDSTELAHRARRRLRACGQAQVALAPKEKRPAGRELLTLSTRLGAALDLALLAEFVRGHQGGGDETAKARLLDQIERRSRRRRTKLLRRATKQLTPLAR